MDNIERLNEVLRNSKDTVFFGGAGVSTESGIPDFRGESGLFSVAFDYPPETVLSHRFFTKRPEVFWEFYFQRMVYTDAKPNQAHLKLAEMEKAGKLAAVITQNIDGLHQAAGSRIVFELHGSIHRNYCMECGKFFPLEYIYKFKNTTRKPICDECGGIIKPDVVLYQEPLDQVLFSNAVKKVEEAEVLLVGGTSLNVYPAAGLLRHFNGEHLILINKSATRFDTNADIVIHGKIGEILGQVDI